MRQKESMTFDLALRIEARLLHELTPLDDEVEEEDDEDESVVDDFGLDGLMPFIEAEVAPAGVLRTNVLIISSM